eukprot:1284941-Pyramimonas_sp.AAC.1
MGRNGQKSGRYVVCSSCKGWMYADKLKRARGWCRCGDWLGFGRTQSGAEQRAHTVRGQVGLHYEGMLGVPCQECQPRGQGTR